MQMPILVVILLIVVFTLVSAVLLQWLWNWTMPQQFGLKPLNYGPALRLMLIGWLLTGSACQFKAGSQVQQRAWPGWSSGVLPAAQ